MKNNKVLPSIITTITVLYLLVAPLIYQNYVNNGINSNATGVCLTVLGFVLFMLSFMSWIALDNK